MMDFLLLSFEVNIPGPTVLLPIVSEYKDNLSYRASQAVIVVSGIPVCCYKIVIPIMSDIGLREMNPLEFASLSLSDK
jgi:hypothetical protein